MSIEVKTLKVEGMSCSHCENTVKKAVGALNGVESVIVDLEGKKVRVDFNSEKVSIETIKEVIEDQGYEIKK